MKTENIMFSVFVLYYILVLMEVMSMKNKQMDKHFQIFNAKKIIQIELDYFSLIDSKLFFPENMQELKKKYGKY